MRVVLTCQGCGLTFKCPEEEEVVDAAAEWFAAGHVPHLAEDEFILVETEESMPQALS